MTRFVPSAGSTAPVATTRPRPGVATATRIAALSLVLPFLALDAQTSGGRGGRAEGPPSMGGGSCSANAYNCPDAPNPITGPNTVWLEEMTWMDVRDAMKAGKTTVIIPTGGIEPNGPWIALGKHNFVLHTNCEAIARKLGNALCAPIIKLVPEGGLDPATSHMTTRGTLSMRETTFRAVLTDVVHSLKMHGFTNIILIGDSGGNQGGQRFVADSLTQIWQGSPIVAHVQEYYDYAGVATYMKDKGVADTKAEGLHDDPVISLNILVDDPRQIRYDERVKAGLASINGVSLADKQKALELGKQIVDYRATTTVEAIRKAIANKGTLPAPARRAPGQ